MATIVMVDDDELLCAIVTRTVAPLGHTVVAVPDGDDAVDVLWECGPDLAILDCALPGKTGLAILREIRQSAMFRTLPVLILTARRSEWHAKLAMEAGANDYVRKPFEPGALIDKIEHLLTTAPQPQDAGSPLDMARLADLRAAVGHAQADTLLAMMATDIVERTSRIAALLEEEDFARAVTQAHALRGAADGIGALNLAEQCRAIEHQIERTAGPLSACATATVAAIERARRQTATSSA